MKEQQLRELISDWRAVAASKFLQTYNRGKADGLNLAANSLELALNENENLIQPGDNRVTRLQKTHKTSSDLLDTLREEV